MSASILSHSLEAASTADWFTAFGTISAVIFAVSIQIIIWFREWWKRPALTLTADHRQWDRSDAFPVLRLAVSNKRGKRRAEEVYVRLIEITEYGGGGRVRWFPGNWFKWDGGTGDSLPRVWISAGETRYLRIGIGIGYEQSLAGFQLALTPEPSTFGDEKLRPGHWALHVAITAANTDTTYRVIVLSFGSTVEDGGALRLTDEQVAIRSED